MLKLCTAALSLSKLSIVFFLFLYLLEETINLSSFLFIYLFIYLLNLKLYFICFKFNKFEKFCYTRPTTKNQQSLVLDEIRFILDSF